MTGHARASSSRSKARSLRTARNRCTRTVASLSPSARLTSAVVCSAMWQSVNTSRWRFGSCADGRADRLRALGRDEPRLGVGARRHRLGRRRVGLARHWQRPPQPARARLAEVEAAVDENAREPHLERQLLAVARDVREHLHERVLHRFVGVVDVAEVLVGDADGPALLPGDELAEPLAGGVALSGQHERLDGAGDLGFLGQRPADGAALGGRAVVSARRGSLSSTALQPSLYPGRGFPAFRPAAARAHILRVDLLRTRPVRFGASSIGDIRDMTTQVERAFGLEALGIVRSGRVHWNLSPAALYEQALSRGEAQLAAEGRSSPAPAPTPAARRTTSSSSRSRRARSTFTGAR